VGLERVKGIEPSLPRFFNNPSDIANCNGSQSSVRVRARIRLSSVSAVLRGLPRDAEALSGAVTSGVSGNPAPCLYRSRAGSLNRVMPENTQDDNPSGINWGYYYQWRDEWYEIKRYRWILSEKAGYDIQLELAMSDWIVKHRKKWREARKLGQHYAPDNISEVPLLFAPQLQEINRALYSHLSKHPELMHDLSPRKFEEFIADILKDMGYEVELTPQTRDGGRDILAVFRTPIAKILTVVECKKYRSDRKVGLDIVERFFHVIDRKDNASCGLVATTSSFSPDAQALARQFDYRLKLRDFNGIKEWIAQYGKWKKQDENSLWTPAHLEG